MRKESRALLSFSKYAFHGGDIVPEDFWESARTHQSRLT